MIFILRAKVQQKSEKWKVKSEKWKNNYIMEQNSNNIVDVHYLQTGKATATDALGMREMQDLADYLPTLTIAAKNHFQYIGSLIK